MNEDGLDAIVCAVPANVVMMSGYWPVTGSALAIVTSDGRTTVLAPEDEEDLIDAGWADDIYLFRSGSLNKISGPLEGVREALERAAGYLSFGRGRVGYEAGPILSPASYVSTRFYCERLVGMIREVLPFARLLPADDLLRRLRAVKTSHEIERIRRSCSSVARAFHVGVEAVDVGRSEAEIAGVFRGELTIAGIQAPEAVRSEGYAFCMSGPNAAEAFGSYARTSRRNVSDGDLVLVHCNACVDGYWTDITRTYLIAPGDDMARGFHDAVMAARRAVLETIRPGIAAAEVDAAARDVLASRGFGDGFKHPTGHGVGFSAIDHRASPMIHPRSDEALQSGMVFNIEPAIYVDGYGGLRHCDMVAVTGDGVELLTPFQSDLDELTRPHP